MLLFSVSVWNGGGFYIEVFGRKFERELEALRKELAEAAASRSGAVTPAVSEGGLHADTSPVLHARTSSDGDISDAMGSPLFVPQDLAHPDSTPVEGLGLDTGGEPPAPERVKKEQ